MMFRVDLPHPLNPVRNARPTPRAYSLIDCP